MRQAISAVDPTVPITDLATLGSVVANAEGERRFVTALLLAFAGAALLLSAVGLYGILSQAVASRTREMGLRMAVGATPSSLQGMVVRQGMVLSGVGALVGLVGAFWLTGLLRGLLYGVEPLDPSTFGVVIALLGSVALGTTAVPAWRATRTDPVSALRSDCRPRGGARACRSTESR